MKEGAGKAISTFVMIILSLAICFSLVQFSIVNNNDNIHPRQENEVSEYKSSTFLDEDVEKTISEVPEGLSAKEWDRIQDDIQKAMYYPTWNEASNGFRALNPMHKWHVAFDRGSTTVRSESGEDWSWFIAPSGYGYEGNILPVLANPRVGVSENRIEFIYNKNLTGWYINDEKGIEHGFNIAAPPQPRMSAELIIELELNTSLIPKTTNNPSEIVFQEKSGAIALNYGKLLVTDTVGNLIPASLHLSKDSRILKIVINDTNAVYPLFVDPLLTSEVKKLTASDGAADDRFGFSVTIFGDTIAVGSINDESAYVFERDQGGADNWGEFKKIKASDSHDENNFGSGVSLNVDTLIVGSSRSTIGLNDNQGSAYIFYRDHGGVDNWGEVTKIIASDGEADDYFGQSVSISGNTAIVGAFFDDIGSDDWQGSAYIFERDYGGADNWGQVKKLTALDGAAQDMFGMSVSISGNTAVVGSRFDDIGLVTNQGSAYIFYRDQGGSNNWGQVRKITASDGSFTDTFGSSVSISGDLIVVGAYWAYINGNSSQGAAYIYERNNGGANNWGEVKKLWAVDGGPGDHFGDSVSINGDKVIVGSPDDDIDGKTDQGSAYLFDQDQGGIDNWGEAAKLTALDGAADDRFGRGVSIGLDTIVIGADYDDNGSKLDQGSAYVYSFFYPTIDPVITTVDDTTTDEDMLYYVNYQAFDPEGDPMTWSLWTDADGWLTINQSSGELSGIPDNSDIGNWTVNVTVKDDNVGIDFTNFTLTVINADPIITTPDDTSATEDVQYYVDYASDDDGQGTITWSLWTDAGSWLTFNTSTAVLSGTPNGSHLGNWTVNVSVNDGNGGLAFSNFTLVVSKVPAITTVDVTAAVEDTLYYVDYASDVDGLVAASWFLWTDADGWLTINQGSGVLSGTPDNSDVGTWTVNVTVEDENGGIDFTNFTLAVINTAPVITTLDDASATEDVQYHVDYASDDDGQGAITWDLWTNAGSWLTINTSSGVLSGTPNGSHLGSWAVNVSVNDGCGGLAFSNFTLVVGKVPAITTIDITTTIEDTLYYVDYASDVDGLVAVSWFLWTDADGWLTFNQSSGILSGTPDNRDVSSWTVNVTVEDENGGIDFTNFTLTVINADPVITTPDEVSATEDVQYYVDYASDDDGQGTITWSLWTDAGSWLTINTSTGVLSGTPDNAVVGSWEVNVSVNDGNGGIHWSNFTLVVNNTDPVIVTSDDTTADEDSLYIMDYDSDDDGQGTITWSLNTNATWLVIDPDSGILNGTPTNDDVGTFWVNVSVSDGNGGIDWSNFILTVFNVNDEPIITTTDLTSATEDILYLVDYNATDIDPTADKLTWSISYTDCEGWLVINESTGVLSGTPINTDVNSWTVNVTVDDGIGGIDWSNFTLVVNNSDPIILTSDDTTADEDTFYFVDYDSDDDGQGIITWSLATNATWLAIDPNTGNISGTPLNNNVGPFWVNVTVSDGNGGSDFTNFTLVVSNVNPGIVTSDDSTADEDSPYTADYSSDDDGQGTIAWSLGTNATWLSINSFSGVLSGNPTNENVGSFWVNVSVSDGNGGMDSTNFTLVVRNMNPGIVSSDVTFVDEDSIYSVDYDSDDDDQGMITWSLSTNATWLTIDSNTGFLNGTTTNDNVGEFWVNVTVSDGNGGIDWSNFSLIVLNVNDDPIITTSDIISASEDIIYLIEYSATDIDPTVDLLIWAFATNATWLSFDTGTEELSGMPTNDDVGIYWVNVSVADEWGGMNWTNFTLTVYNVNDGVVITTIDNTTATEDSLYFIDYNADDPDFWDTLTWSISYTDTKDWLTIDSITGVLSGTPNNTDVGIWIVNVTVIDGNGEMDWSNFSLTVSNVNDPPEISTADIVYADEDAFYYNDYNASDIDPHQDTLTWSLITNATGGWLNIDSVTGILSGSSDNSAIGSYWVNASVSDGNGGLDFHNFTLVINNIPPAIITSNVRTALNGTLYFVDYESNDDDQGTITWSLTTNATWLSIDTDTGELSGTPANVHIGYYWVNISVDDGNRGTYSTYFTLTVFLDTDGDGVSNQDDDDDDNDGVLDNDDYYPIDATKWKKLKEDGFDINIIFIILAVIIISIIFIILLIKRRKETDLIVEQIEFEEIPSVENEEDQSWDDFIIEEETQSPSQSNDK